MIGNNLGQEVIPAENGSAMITFNVLEDFNVNGFNVTASGFNAGKDIEDATFTYDMMIYSFGDIRVKPNGILADGEEYVPGFYTFQAGDMIAFDFSGNGNADRISVDVTFAATPVPLPAGGLLLLSALGAGVVASRRKKA